MNYQDINASTIDRWIEEGWEWGIPIDHETFVNAKEGKWDMLLTPTKFVPHEWFGDLNGKKLLGLASGGGQQMPIFAALGAECTVLDYSEKQLESERMVAAREGYEITIIRADMTKPLPFGRGKIMQLKLCQPFKNPTVKIRLIPRIMVAAVENCKSCVFAVILCGIYHIIGVNSGNNAVSVTMERPDISFNKSCAPCSTAATYGCDFLEVLWCKH
jgi:hypothetical protein